MSIKTLNPYLLFNGDAEKAIRLYERALGAKLEGNIMRYGEVPGGQPDSPHKDLVMHAMLRLGGGVLMVSDAMPGTPVKFGESVHVCLDFDDPADMAQRFDALAAGGKVDMALQDTFWGAIYGQVIDAHGIHWMFNYTKEG
jgi:PhnB protein